MRQHYKFKPARYFQRRTLDVFRKYSWPGNVRELISVIENHMIQANEPAITPENLSLKLYQGGSAIGIGGLLLQDFEAKQGFDKQAFILEAIESVGGSKAEAARRLGVTPQHLQYILGDSKSAKLKSQKPTEMEGSGKSRL